MALLKFSQPPNVIAAGIKMLALLKLSFRAGKCIKEDDGVINYIQKNIKEGDTVLDIGPQQGESLYFIRKKLKQSGRIIAFEPEPLFHQNLSHLKKILDWKNVELESIRLSNVLSTKNVRPSKHNPTSHSAIVINISCKQRNKYLDKVMMQTLDNYCSTQNIKPDFLKIDARGNELRILQGAINTLKTFKPKILVKCEERLAGAENVMETFKLLKQLDYTGYFTLDAINIPLVNFDFNVYQNSCKDFYCSNFMFE